jgi:hypothetical protein
MSESMSDWRKGRRKKETEKGKRENGGGGRGARRRTMPVCLWYTREKINGEGERGRDKNRLQATPPQHKECNGSRGCDCHRYDDCRD